MIKTTLGALVDAESVLAALGKQKLPVKTAYNLAKLTKLVRSELQLFHEKRTEFITELGVERDATPEEAAQYGPKITAVAPENRLEFTRRLSELATIEVDLASDPLPLDALSSIELTPDEISALGLLIQVD